MIFVSEYMPGHPDPQWNKDQSLVNIPDLHQSNMAATQGKIPLENWMNHRWEQAQIKGLTWIVFPNNALKSWKILAG